MNDVTVNYSGKNERESGSGHEKESAETDPRLTSQYFLFSSFYLEIPAMKGAMTNDTIDINLMRIFIEGPEVSLNGSPTVSPVTDALCGSDPL